MHDSALNMRFPLKETSTIMQNQNITSLENWPKMFSILSSFPKIHVKNESSIKKLIDSLAWLMRSGARWRDMPPTFGRGNSIFKRFARWAKLGVWDNLFKQLIDEPDMEYSIIDSTIVKVHVSVNVPLAEQEKECLGRSVGGYTSKIHALVDALGYPLKFEITSGAHHDITQAMPLTVDLFDTQLLADKAYGAGNLRACLKAKNCAPVIPYKSNALNPESYDSELYKERNLVERFFLKIKRFRRLFSRFDKKLLNFKAFLTIAGASLWIK